MKTKEKLSAAILQVLPWFRQYWDRLATVWLILCMITGTCWFFFRMTAPEELARRHSLVETARQYLGYNEADGSHRTIVDRYNSYRPSPRSYQVTYSDNWCATFGSAAALEAGMTDLIPMECSCEQQINLFREMGRWREDECYLPRSGDYIYYVWDEWRSGDCTAWAEHVGIVDDTFGPVIRVIEGNKDDSVAYRYIFLNDITIRGFGLPDYTQ